MSKIQLIVLCLLNSVLNFAQDTLVFKSDTLNFVVIKGYKYYDRIYYEFKTNYKIKDGLSIEEYGKIKTKCTYVNNKRHGYLTIEKNDTIIESKEFRMGLLHGQSFEKHNLYTSLGRYKNNHRVGKWIYRKDENILAKGKFKGLLTLKVVNGEDLYIFSNGDTIKCNNTKIILEFSQLYDYYIQKANTHLRYGRWIFYDNKGNKALIVRYNNLGQVTKRKLLKKEFTQLEYLE